MLLLRFMSVRRRSARSARHTRGQCGYYDATHTLVEASEHGRSIERLCSAIGVETLIVGGLQAGFECIERVDKQVDCKRGNCSGLGYR